MEISWLLLVTPLVLLPPSSAPSAIARTESKSVSKITVSSLFIEISNVQHKYFKFSSPFQGREKNIASDFVFSQGREDISGQGLMW
jgi:hypothetical protein